MRAARILTVVFVCTACSVRSAPGEGEASGTTSTGTDTLADLPSTGDGDGDPLADPCGCEDEQLCVGDCIWGDFNPDWVGNGRCIDAAVCNEEGWSSSPCTELACGSPFAKQQPQCGDSAGFDIICNPESPPSCDATKQDCPELEKCVPQAPDPWGYEWNRCVPILGEDALGEPCTSEGADLASEGTDSCDAEGMCWNGALSVEPFEGTCQPFCDFWNDLSCPDGMSCTPITELYDLCLPTP